MKSAKNVVSSTVFDNIDLDSKCYGFDLFFEDRKDLDKFSDGLMIAWANHPALLGFSGNPKSISRSVDEYGGILTYIWEEPTLLKPLEGLSKIRTFMTGHEKMKSSFSGSELYIRLD